MPASDQDPAARLTPRQREVAPLVLRGWTNREIAAALFISPETVKWHVGELLRKLRLGSRRELVWLATAEGWEWLARSVDTGPPQGGVPPPPIAPENPPMGR